MISKTKFDYHRLIVNCFCEFEKGMYGFKLQGAEKVYAKYPDPSFWDWMIINCNFKLPNIEFLLTEEGARFIQEKYQLMNAHESKKPFTEIGSGGKIGKDKKYITKPTNVLDFIKDGEKKEN